MKSREIFTIGYSLYRPKDFIEILKNNSVNMLVDIRTIPRSRHRPEFNKDALRSLLKRHKIGYMHFKELGGLRKPSKDSINTAWINESFRGFADYMQTREFKAALSKLVKLAKKKNIVLMCAEGNPFRCHRSLIADALTIKGFNVFEIRKKSRTEHKLTGFAKVSKGVITYPSKGGNESPKRAV